MKSKKIAFLSILLIILVIGSISVMAIYNKNKIKNNQTIKDSGVNSETNGREANNGSTSSNNLLKTNEDGSVEVTAILEGSTGQDQKYINIQVQFDTHSVNLDSFDFSKNVIFKTSDGISLDKEIIWEKASGGGHHYEGIYKIPKQLNGKPIIQANTEYIELDIKNLHDVPNRSFRWNKDDLGSIKI